MQGAAQLGFGSVCMLQECKGAATNITLAGMREALLLRMGRCLIAEGLLVRCRFDSIGTLPERKLAALALAQALTLPLPALLDRLELIAACLTSVWFEVSLFYCAQHACVQ